ncbi:MAG TPA: hypothetical protein VIV11_29475 [Kofleriaceae bacterium]
MRGLLVLAFSLGCSNHAGQGDDGPPSDASATSVQLACESNGTTFPPLEKACSAATDCFVARHTKNCCGTQNAIGLNKSAEAAFMQAETVCDAAYPGCGCAQFPTEAEDGRTEDLGMIEVRCDAGLCTTYVP